MKNINSLLKITIPSLFFFAVSVLNAAEAPTVSPLANESLEVFIQKTSMIKELQTPGSFFKAAIYASENVDKSDVIVQMPDGTSDYLFFRVETALEEIDSMELNFDENTKLATVTVVGRNYIATERFPDQSLVKTVTITLTKKTSDSSTGYTFLDKPSVSVSEKIDSGKEPN